MDSQDKDKKVTITQYKFTYANATAPFVRILTEIQLIYVTTLLLYVLLSGDKILNAECDLRPLVGRFVFGMRNFVLTIWQSIQ